MLRKISYGLLLAAIAFVFWPAGGQKTVFAAVSMEPWSNLPEPIPGASASAVLSGNKILVTGGQNGSNSKSKNSYVFDTISKTWTTNAPTLPVAYHKQSMLRDGRVLVTGGNAFENSIGYVYNDLARIYNPQTNAWTNAANVPHTVLGQTQSTLADGRVMIVGGSNEVYYPGTSITYNNSYIYDPSTNRWDEAAPLPITLYEAAQSTLKDGRVLLTGGLNGYAYSYASFIYDPASNTWTKAASLPYAYEDIFFRHSQVTLENGKVLVMGNYNFYIYDPVTNNWTKDSENTGHLTDASLVSIGSDVYVVSGYDYLDYSTNTKLYKLTFDFTAPTAPTITGGDSGWNGTDVDVTITPGTDAGTGVDRTEYSLSGATTLAWTTYSEADFIHISNSGQTTVTARTVDKAGNISDTASTVVKIDKTAPLTPIINLSANGWTANNVTAALSASSDSGGSGVSRREYSLSGATSLGWTTYSGTVTIAAAGETTFHARDIDEVGNVSAEGSAVIQIDKAPPLTPSITPTSTAWNQSDVTVTIAPGTDSGGSGISRTEYQLTGAKTLNWTSYSSSFVIGTEGLTTVEARTIDNAGNISATKSVTLKLDKTLPTAPTVTPDSTAWTNAASVKAAVTAGTDGGSGVSRTEYSLSGATTLGWTTYTGQVTISAEGQTTLSARTVDIAGNISAVTTGIVKIDRTTPGVPDIKESTIAWTAADATFTLAPGTDSGSGASRTEYMLSGGTTLGWTTYTGAVTITEEGQTTINARTVDQAGNTSGPRLGAILIDKTKPTTPVITPSATGWSVSDVSVSIISGTDKTGSGVSKTEYKMSGATTKDWTTYSTAFSISAEGQTMVEARTIDKAGNISTVATVTVMIDKTKPTAPTVTQDASGWTNASSVSATIMAGTDSSSGVNRTEYSLSGAMTLGWTTYSGQMSINAEGLTTINARSVDNAGNISPVSTSSIKIDRTAPTIPSISPDSGEWSAVSISVTLTAGADSASAVERVEYKLTGATTLDWTAYTGPINLTKEGITIVSARTVDKAGNVSAEFEAAQSLDLSAPGAAILSSDAPDWTSADSVNVAAEAGTDSGGSGVNRVEYSLSGAVTSTWKLYTGPILVTAEGQTEVTVRTVDNAGNLGAESKKTVKIDRTAPSKPDIQADATGWTSADIKVTVTPGTDPLSGASRTEYRLLGATTLDWTTYTGTITVTAAGETSVQARMVDEAGNFSDTSVLNVHIDKTAPIEPQVLVEKEGWISAAKVAFSITAGTDQGGSAVDRTEYKLTGAATKDWTTYAGAVDIEAEGATTISARTIDAAGNVGPVQEVTIRIDRSSPTIPSIKPETTDWISADSVKVTITAGEDIGESGIEKSEYRITGAGARDWTVYTGEISITAEGVSTIYARSVDQAGNIGPSAELIVRIDRTPPSAPVTQSPVNGEVLGDNLPTIVGTAEENSIIAITIDGEELPAVTTDSKGSWTYTPVSPLKDGKHQIRVSVKDAVGNAAAEEDVLTFTVDTTAPEAPVIEEPVNDAISGISKPVFKGHAEAGSKVTLYIGDSQIKSITADEDGNWSYTIVTPLEDGIYVLKATAADAVGNVGSESGLVSWTVDTNAPVAPVVLAPINGNVTNENKLTISGTAEAGSLITIEIDNKKMAEKKATSLGAWSFTLTEALADGKHIITTEAADEAGNIGPASETVEIMIDTEAPEVAVITAPTEGEQLNKTKPQLRGSAEAGAWIHLTLDGTTVDPFKVGESGIWSYSPSEGLSDGIHRVKINVTDEAGNVKEEAVELRFVIDTTAPEVPVITQPTAGSRTNVTKPTLVGTAEKQSRVNILLDDEAAAVVEADEDGNWEFIPVVDLAIGRHMIQVQAEDNAGNESGMSAEHDFEIVSSNAELSKLTLSDVKLNELFQSTQLDYTARVNYSVSSTEITAVPSDSNAAVEILLEDGQQAGKPVKLKVGEQRVIIRVTAQDGTTIRTYKVTITRNQYVEPKPDEPETPETPEPVKLISCKPEGDNSVQFTDMAGHWANQAVQHAYGCGVVKGFNDSTFHPDAQVTRAEFVTMLMNTVLDSSEPAGSGEGFSDSSNIPAWAANAVAESKGYGFVNGFADGSFRPNEQVTRAELITMLAKAAGIKPLEADKVTGMFADADDIPAWAAGYVAALQEKGLLQGRGDGKFEPTGHATRAEAAVLLLRIIEFRQD
ncbi:OmpL47-type beta-barrel domain-containing protein [Paenibacillus sp. YAF4_2]|uniref:OmpL47-type beta-barrel domain-containing protein n=1 Tax=Paenibacillus sp. YAF4_2 TaxID=3233085 RepID=UPI003F958E9E